MTTVNSEPRSGRREFLTRCKSLILTGVSITPFAAAIPLLASQTAHTPVQRPGFPAPPAPADPSAQDTDAPKGADPQTAKRVIAARNEKEFREGVEKLYQMASELRDELAQSPKMNVLSVRMYKKTEEIEKLAKQLKSKAKGG
jgi:hypothetical protein